MIPRRLERLPRWVLDGDAVVHEASTFASRLLGLAWLHDLPSGHALFIPECRSVHTFGMRFPIDVAFIDEWARPLRIERSVPPRRVLVCRGAFAVLETRAGEIARFVARGPRSVG
jgi:uncharacterized membrane protein (UPF0127 family)